MNRHNAIGSTKRFIGKEKIMSIVTTKYVKPRNLNNVQPLVANERNIVTKCFYINN